MLKMDPVIKKIDVEAAKTWLGEAIAVHQGHMDGTVPVNDQSQMDMMDMMKKAYKALDD